MKELKRTELRPGMRFDRPLYLPDGQLIVQAGVQLSNDDLERMEKWQVEILHTEGNLLDGAPVVSAAAVAAALQPAAAPVSAAAGGDNARLEQIRRMTELRVLAQKKKEIIALYSSTLDAARQVIETLSTGLPVDKQRIDDLVQPLIAEVPKYKNIFVGCALQKGGSGDYLFSHSLNVCIFSLVIGAGFDYSRLLMQDLAIGALLHDVGMLKVPKHIREKKRKLEESEYNLIKTHPIHGYRILNKYKVFSLNVQAAVLQHHECFDGSGYPQKMSGEGIADLARVISVADVFDALTKKRSWRDENKGYDAMRNILQESESRFDPRALKVFLANMAIYPIGSLVQLNTKEYAVVVDANEKTPLRPTVKVLFDPDKRRLVEARIVDLLQEPSLMIARGIDREELDVSTVDEL
ncbi:MAG TPA: HD-GYP domain-containing protein [bacterium]|nr:HD-GYP domain-containing protein [bacterium]